MKKENKVTSVIKLGKDWNIWYQIIIEWVKTVRVVNDLRTLPKNITLYNLSFIWSTVFSYKS
jgi:protein gp37